MPAEFQATAEDNGAGEQAVADAQAAARAEQGILPETSPEPNEAPAWCPEKYARFNDDGTFNADMSATEMSKGMDHLNKMATQNAQGQEPADDDDNADVITEEADDNTGDDDLPAPEHEPLTSPEFWEEMRQEYVNTNELSAESRQIIRDMGIPDQMVADYIEGQQARSEGFTNTVTSILPGGQAEYEALIDWADTNLYPAEAEVFNDAILSGEVTKAQIALRGLKHQHAALEGSTADLLGGSPSGSSGDSVAGFTSRAEMSAAIQDPRYSRDATYRAGVEQRVLRTNL